MLLKILVFLKDMEERINGDPEISLHYSKGPLTAETNFYLKATWLRDGYVLAYKFSMFDVMHEQTTDVFVDYIVDYFNHAYRKKMEEGGTDIQL